MRVPRRLRSRQFRLLAVLIAALAAVGYGQPDGTTGADGMSIPPSAQADEAPSMASHTPVPEATPPAERVPPVGIAALPPSPAPSEAESEATHPPGPATMPASAPARLQISSIGVDSALTDLGLQADGTLEVPPGAFPAGWYTGSPSPGELGPAIIAGHVDWAGQPGVFYNLRDLATGDEIAVTRQDGSTATFRVTRAERFDKNEFPTQAVYGDLDHAGLRLITCGGAFDRQARSYKDNIVVFAELTGTHTR